LEGGIYICVMTPHHKWDADVLYQCLQTDFVYLGMMASPKKAREIKQKMIDRGVPKELVERVSSPIGLDINSHTPAEIAVSIVAELIKVRNSKKEGVL